MMAKRTRRPRDQLPNCYYEGYLERRSFKEEVNHQRRSVCLFAALDCKHFAKQIMICFNIVTNQQNSKKSSVFLLFVLVPHLLNVFLIEGKTANPCKNEKLEVEKCEHFCLKDCK